MNTNLSKELIEKIFLRSKIWSSVRNITDDTGVLLQSVQSNITQLSKIGFIIGFTIALVQILYDICERTYGNNINPLRSLQRTYIKILLCTLLLMPPVYELVTLKLIANNTDRISAAITATYLDNFLSSYLKMYTAIGESIMKPGSLLSTSIFEMMTASLIAGVLFFVSAALVLVMPLLYSALFAFAFYLGPICIPFMISDLTSYITRGWFSFIMTVSFMSVIGSLSFMVCDSSQIIANIQKGGGAENVLIILVNGILAVVIFLSSYHISSAIFGSGVSMSSTVTNPLETARTSGNVVVTGGTMALGAGSMAIKGGAAAVALAGFGMKGLSMVSPSSEFGKMCHGASTKLMGTGRAIYNLSDGKFGPDHSSNISNVDKNKESNMPIQENMTGEKSPNL